MYAGRVMEEGPVRRVFTAPRHPYTQKLMSSFPNIRADRRTLDVIPGSPPDLRQKIVGCPFAPRCPAAMAVCSEVMPPEVRFADGVRVACHLYPPSVAGTLAAPVPVTAAEPIDAAPAPDAGPPAGDLDPHAPEVDGVRP
jgi:oligopeptide/dipeptide ABC transporter ATP-binding protein